MPNDQLQRTELLSRYRELQRLRDVAFGLVVVALILLSIAQIVRVFGPMFQDHAVVRAYCVNNSFADPRRCFDLGFRGGENAGR